MFINHTNHPSSKWGEEQKSHAIELSGGQGIEDVSFPNINPQLSGEEVNKLAVHNARQLYDKGHTRVLVQGEMCYVHHFVTEANKLGVFCFVACSERVSVENKDGSITKQFRFVQFRQY